MTIETQKLRDTAKAAKAFASVGVVTHPHTAKAHINGLADAVATCCGEIDAKAAEIERLKKSLRIAVLALAHATQEYGRVYEPAYKAVDAALSGD